MIAQELEVSLHMAFVEARQKRHEFITVEHLLLALLDNPTAAEVLRACAREHRRAPQAPHRVHQRPYPDRRRHRGDRHPADARLPARDPARDPARAVLRQEGGDRRQRPGCDLRREGLARGVLPAPAGRDAARRRQLHLARHHQEPAAGAAQGDRERGSRRGRPAVGRRARDLHRQPERPGAGRQDRPADRSRPRARARDPDALPPAQEQPAAGRRGRRGQDRDRGRPRAPDRRGPGARDTRQVPGVRARHGRAPRRYQVSRRFRAAPEGGAQAARGQPERDSLHRRDPHADRRRRRLGRDARRVEPAEAGAVDRAR